tara:strand:+ start:246 stop:362 length:117 start_codon:yes stop_codon:yes gene_type:complete
MIKKIILIMMCLVVLASCGRKGDPEFKAKKLNIVMHKV